MRGGAIRAGETIMVFVPKADNLTVEAKLAPQDIDQVRLGQSAALRFSAFNQRTTPEISGDVGRISADITTDDRSGTSYYTGRIAMTAKEVARLGDVAMGLDPLKRPWQYGDHFANRRMAASRSLRSDQRKEAMDGTKKSERLSDWRVTLFVFMFIGATCLFSVSSYTQSRGQFVGRLVTEWLDDGRNMRLIERFSYKDPKRAIWDVPEGAVVNGASIPSLFWSFIGSPFGDKYRKASVIHDYYCETRTRDSEDVHRVFFDAMLDSGVGSSKAWVMYQAVRQFGPNWQLSAAVGPTCERVNGQIDFSTCTQNAQQEKPDVVQRLLDRDSLNRFIENMKREGHEEAAEELVRSLD